jgi:hypothetical protein
MIRRHRTTRHCKVKFERRLSQGLQALASYTWSHSIDIASTDAFANYLNAPNSVANPTVDRGDSDFDIRHAFTAGVTYNLPSPELNEFAHAALGGWSVYGFIFARTAPPVDVVGAIEFTESIALYPRPDVVPRVPLVLHGRSFLAARPSILLHSLHHPHFLVAELALPMAKRGKGAIVNISAMVADYGALGMSLYGSSKAAINLLTKTWAAEYGPKGVRVNAVSPVPTRTEGIVAMGEVLNSSPPRRPRVVRQPPTKSPKRLSSWPQTVPASFTAQNLPRMEGAPPSEQIRQLSRFQSPNCAHRFTLCERS